MFTKKDLRKALIAAAGGKLTMAYWEALKQPLERIIEAVELVRELNDKRDATSQEWDSLFEG